LFTERSEITINYKTPEDLEAAIKERVKRLLNANIIDITPLPTNLDEELGVAGELEREMFGDDPTEENGGNGNGNGNGNENFVEDGR
jgi:hypothetical protein